MRLAMCFAIFGLGLTVCTCGSCSSLWQSYPEDNIVEEIAEEVIDQETGLDLDLSPFSSEEDVKIQIMNKGM